MGSVVLPLLILLLAGTTPTPVAAVGVNWGTMISHHMLPSDVVQMLKANGICKVKLFDADSWTVSALAGTSIEVMLAIPNDQLQRMNNYDHAKDWVKENVTTHLYEGGVKIKYVAVGNEAFLKSYNRSFDNTMLPAMKNIQKALEEAGFGNRLGRPGYYLFGLIDEDMKSILPRNFERHWGIFTYDGRPKFAMDLSGKGRDGMLVGVKNVEYLPMQWCVFNDGVEEKEMVGVAESMKYACSLGDCTALRYGSRATTSTRGATSPTPSR